MDPMQTFVTHVLTSRYEDLSPEVVETVKITVLDTVGAALAGSASEAGRGIARLARRYGGAAGGSTLVVHGGTVAPPMAALGNGVMARCLELDGTHETGGGHVGVCMVPAALALVESAPAPVDGRTLVLGLALGVDMLCRLRMGAGKSKAIGWMAETMAPMAIAAMGSRLLGLPEDTMHDAIGVAYASCSGNVQPTVEGAWSLWTPAGTAAAGGLLAIDMAREGFRGPRHVLCGEFGLYRLYFRGDYDEEALLGDLGDEDQLLDRARYIKALAVAVGHKDIQSLADRLIEAHSATVDWLTTVLAEDALGGPAALRRTPLQAATGAAVRFAYIPMSLSARGLDKAIDTVRTAPPALSEVLNRGAQARDVAIKTLAASRDAALETAERVVRGEGADGAADALHNVRAATGVLSPDELPIADYTELNVSQAVAAVKDLTEPADIRAIIAFEEAHKNRHGVVSAAQTRLADIAKEVVGIS